MMKKLFALLLFALSFSAGAVDTYNTLDRALYPTTYGTSGYCWTSNGIGVVPSWQVCSGGGGGTPGGASGDIQYNNAGSFGGITPGTGVSTWIATPSSANLAAAVTGETGTGALVFGTSPTLVTPTLGAASATSVTLATAGGVRTSTSAGNTLLLQAYDVDGASYTTFGTLTANNTPTFDLSANITIGGQVIPSLTGTPTAGCVTIWTGLTTQALSCGTVAGTFLRYDGSNPSWSTLVFPNAATSGGVLYGSAANVLSTSGALTANLPVIGGGAGNPPTSGTRSGNTTAFVTTTGTQTSGDCVKIDANGNHIANGSACGGGSSALSSITAAAGANTIASGNNSGQVWNWALTTDSTRAFTFGETTAATNGTSTSGVPNQAIARFTTLAASTASPLQVYSRAAHVFSVAPDAAQVLFATGTIGNPVISFAADPTSGFGGFSIGPGGYLFGQMNGQRVFTGAANQFLVGDGTGTIAGISNNNNGVSGLSFDRVTANSLSVLVNQKEIFKWSGAGGHPTAIAQTINTPTMGACGTSPSIVGTDDTIEVTVGTGGIATSCAVNFGATWVASKVICVANSSTDALGITTSASTTVLTITKTTAFTASSKLNILCRGIL